MSATHRNAATIDSSDLFGSDIPGRTAPPRSALRELLAYEALWLRPGATVLRISSWFRQAGRRCWPSDLVSDTEAASARERLDGVLASAVGRRFTIDIAASDRYPAGLHDAEHLVPVLYRRGDHALFDSAPRVAVIGSREVSEVGIARARRLASDLVGAGITVVSGLARGTDTAAHQGAIDAGGRTIAVLGTPITEVYPKQNAALQERIAGDHLLVSQVPLLRYRDQDNRANSRFFPERNATMSALSQATVIVEARDRSGTLTQAKAALRQGRHLFILASCFDAPALSWPREFERQGARRLTCVEDLITALGKSGAAPAASDLLS